MDAFPTLPAPFFPCCRCCNRSCRCCSFCCSLSCCCLRRVAAWCLCAIVSVSARATRYTSNDVLRSGRRSTFSFCFLTARSVSLVVVAVHTFTLKANCKTILVAFDTVCTRLNRSSSSSDIIQLFSSTSHLVMWEFFLSFTNAAKSANGRRFARPVPSP